MKKQNNLKRSFWLVVISISYLIFGAFIFYYMESDFELESNENLKSYIERFERKHRMNGTEFEELMSFVKHKKVYRVESRSNIMGSFLFCVSLLTLIGYGMQLIIYNI